MSDYNTSFSHTLFCNISNTSHSTSQYSNAYKWMASGYTLWLFNIAMENNPFIDGLSIKNGWIFDGKLLNNQMITIDTYYDVLRKQKKWFFGFHKIGNGYNHRSWKLSSLPSTLQVLTLTWPIPISLSTFES